ncbi:MAG TPA: hypothetical protein PLJ08_12490 [Cyclobacteriaceae bacterium]|nr:hypothetical protein [Cyclobacteriaceae bacterium]
MKNRLNLLLYPPFLVCLVILLLNDFYLKSEYHNWLTGKLSDFSGLFVFVWFWSALFPNRKLHVYFWTGIVFSIWKSPYSQPLIDLFSQVFYPIGRVVDVTDLLALIILPVAFSIKQKSTIILKVSPVPIAFLTLFSFCATSVREPTLQFEQPQYLLFKSGAFTFEINNQLNEIEVYALDTLVVIGVKEIRIDRRAPLDDELHKVQILKDLDLRVLREFSDGDTRADKFEAYKQLRDTLTNKGVFSLRLKLDSAVDELNFKGIRLNGSFKRYSLNNDLLIEGRFINGVEDSIWTFFNIKGKLVSKRFFENGELVSLEIFENDKLKTDQKFNTRKTTIRNKYFHLAVLLVLIIALAMILLYNFLKSDDRGLNKSIEIKQIVLSLILSVFVIILSEMISSVIPNSYSVPIFDIFFKSFFIYLISAFVFVMIFTFLKPKSRFDLLLYFLIISLTIVLVREWIYLKSIS